MISWPVLAVAGLGLWPNGYDDAGDEGPQAGAGDAPEMDPTMSDGREFDGWTYPMAAWRGYQATISQGYKGDVHHGVDIMYKRASGGGADQMFARGTSQGTPMFFCPDECDVLAPRDGYLWSSGLGPTGNYVVISSAKPIAIFMVHMSQLYVPSEIERGEGRIAVKAGQPIGRVGFSPRDAQKLNHLHIEIWRGGGSGSHVDPAPYLRGAIRP